MSAWQLNWQIKEEDDVVVPGLLAGINDFMHPGVERQLYLAREAIPVAIGCTYRFTSVEIADALPIRSCIVVDKAALEKADAGAQHLIQRGRDEGGGLALSALGDQFAWIGRRSNDGSLPKWIDSEVGLGGAGVVENVRVAGRGRSDRRPYMHAKAIVLGYGELDVETDEGDVIDRFTLDRAWIGSANFSVNARKCTELGLWVTDRQLVRDLWQFVVDLIQWSEPPTSTATAPAPDLVDAAPDWSLIYDERDEPWDDEDWDEDS